ncbi:MAG: hypothetical protein ACW964_18750 [Candidatus Hodarchaeales archaeon]|jgi:hypothetical protein
MKIIEDLICKKGPKEVLIYLARNPGSSVIIINSDFTKGYRSKLTTASIYRYIQDFEELQLVTRLPTDKNRFLLTLKAEELILSNNLISKSDTRRLGLKNNHHIVMKQGE